MYMYSLKLILSPFGSTSFFYETLLQLLSILRIYDGLQSFTQSTLIALQVHVPGIFRQPTLHRIILQGHNENIARYFNESEVMMYLHEN